MNIFNKKTDDEFIDSLRKVRKKPTKISILFMVLGFVFLICIPIFIDMFMNMIEMFPENKKNMWMGYFLGASMGMLTIIIGAHSLISFAHSVKVFKINRMREMLIDQYDKNKLKR